MKPKRQAKTKQKSAAAKLNQRITKQQNRANNIDQTKLQNSTNQMQPTMCNHRSTPRNQQQRNNIEAT